MFRKLLKVNEMNIKNVKEAAKAFETATRLLAAGPMEYYLTELTAAHDMLIERFSPYKVGDKVKLAYTFSLKPQSGWYPFRELLVEDEVFVITEVEAGSKGFRYLACHYDDSDDKNPPNFTLYEADLKPYAPVKVFKAPSLLSEGRLKEIFTYWTNTEAAEKFHDSFERIARGVELEVRKQFEEI